MASQSVYEDGEEEGVFVGALGLGARGECVKAVTVVKVVANVKDTQEAIHDISRRKMYFGVCR